MNSDRSFFLRVSLLLISIVIVSCATVPLTGRKQVTLIPAPQMLSLGASSYNEVLKTTKQSANLSYINKVKSVGQRIVPAVEKFLAEKKQSNRIKGYKWEFTVLQSDVQNAWCMPGGKIAFYEGIMPVCIDETGIAVVMAHEIAHAVARHGNERMSQQLAIQMGGVALSVALRDEKESTQQLALAAFGVGSTLGVMLPYSRTHEKEADEMGLYFMAMAGFDPREAPKFWTRMVNENKSTMPEFLSTHPNPQKRIKELNKSMPKALKYYSKQ